MMKAHTAVVLGALLISCVSFVQAQLNVSGIESEVFFMGMKRGRVPTAAAQLQYLDTDAEYHLALGGDNAEYFTLRETEPHHFNVQYKSLSAIEAYPSGCGVVVDRPERVDGYSFYPSTMNCYFNPDTVRRNLTIVIENAPAGIDGEIWTAYNTMNLFGISGSYDFQEHWEGSDFIIEGFVGGYGSNPSTADRRVVMHVLWSSINAKKSTLEGLLFQFLGGLPFLKCDSTVVTMSQSTRLLGLEPNTLDFEAYDGTYTVLGDNINGDVSLDRFKQYASWDGSNYTITLAYDGSPLGVGERDLILETYDYGKLVLPGAVRVGVFGGLRLRANWEFGGWFAADVDGEVQNSFANGTDTMLDSGAAMEGGSSLKQDGNSFVTYKHPTADFAGSSDVSFGGWFYTDNWYSYDSSAVILSGSSASNTHMVALNMSVDVNGDLHFIAGVGDQSLTYTAPSCSTDCPFQGWHHVFVANGVRGMKLYIDGNVKASGVQGYATSGYPNCLAIGGTATTTCVTVAPATSFPGSRVDDVRFYERELDSEGVGHVRNLF